MSDPQPYDRGNDDPRHLDERPNATPRLIAVHVRPPGMPPAPIVVHMRDYRVGRLHRTHTGPLPVDVVRIDRRSIYGNPARARDYRSVPIPERLPAALDYYATLLRSVILAMDPTFLEPLRGHRLACWCKPLEGFAGRLLCHGQVIAGVLYGVPPESVE